jgi:hypothetical protein
MSDHERNTLASPSVARHLARGAIGFGLIGAALTLLSSAGPAALLLAPLGMVALRGCPTCWIAGLIETVSAGRLHRTCTDSRCALPPPATASARRDADQPIPAPIPGPIPEPNPSGPGETLCHANASSEEAVRSIAGSVLV